MSEGPKVGYGKPPVATRFRKGQSGNPRGRSKGARSLATDLEEELTEKISINEGGRPKKITKQRAVVKSQTAKAIKGDARSAQHILGLAQTNEERKAASQEEARLSAEDDAILERFKDYVRHTREKPTNDDQHS